MLCRKSDVRLLSLFKAKRLWWSLLLLQIWAAWVLCQQPVAAAYYNMQSYSGKPSVGSVGGGTLSMSNMTDRVYAGFTRGTYAFQYNLVMFIDSVPGGYTTTGVLSDKADIRQTAISGYGTSRSTANFAPGFAADYAIVVSVSSGSGLYKIVDDGTGPHLQQIRDTVAFGPIGDFN